MCNSVDALFLWRSLRDLVNQHTLDKLVPPEEKAGLEAQAKSKKEADAAAQQKAAEDAAAAAQQKAAEDAAAAATKAAQEAAGQAEIAGAAPLDAPPAPMALDGPSTPGLLQLVAILSSSKMEGSEQRK